MFTRERLLELLPVMAHWAKGGEVQFRRKGEDAWDVCTRNGFLSWDDDFDYRIKPEPELVPFEAKDIRPDWIFRLKGWGVEAWTICVDCGYDNLKFGNGSNPNFHNLFQEWLYSSDNGQTWLPCRKEKV